MSLITLYIYFGDGGVVLIKTVGLPFLTIVASARDKVTHISLNYRAIIAMGYLPQIESMTLFWWSGILGI